MNRRNAMLTFGIGAIAAAVPIPHASATPSAPVPTAPAAGAQTGTFLFHDEFDGPADSAPDPSKWVISSNRTPIKNPNGFDRPEFWGQYRNDRENVFVDGKSNLVLRATKDGDKFFGGLISGNWRGGVGTTWEARIKWSGTATVSGLRAPPCMPTRSPPPLKPSRLGWTVAGTPGA
jgi:beta-glucanase (GH16 family)